MELKAAVKILRKELCLTQRELAQALELSYATINRWETGRTLPDTTAIDSLLTFADARGVSAQCKKYLREALRDSRKGSLRLPSSSLYSVERESICQLVDDSHNAIYVADMETDELLYANHRAEEFFGKKFRAGSGQRCYEFVAGRTTPCKRCYKTQMSENGFSDAHITSASGTGHFHVRGKRINWNGKSAHAQYLSNETGAIEAQDGMKRLLDSVKAGICVGIVYGDGRIELSYLNEGYYAMIGVPRAARQQYTLFSATSGICEEDREAVLRQVNEAVGTRRDFDVMLRITLPENTAKWLNIRGSFMDGNAERTVYTCVITDVDRFMRDTGKNIHKTDIHE